MAPRKKTTRKTASKAPTTKKAAVKKSAPKTSSRAKTAATTRTTRSTKTQAAPATSRITRSASLNTARSNVFNTTELLEKILLHLEPDDILASKRVSQKFDNMIKDTLSIKKRIHSVNCYRNRIIKEDDIESWHPDFVTRPRGKTFKPWDDMTSLPESFKLLVRHLEHLRLQDQR